MSNVIYFVNVIGDPSLHRIFNDVINARMYAASLLKQGYTVNLSEVAKTDDYDDNYDITKMEPPTKRRRTMNRDKEERWKDEGNNYDSDDYDWE